MGKTYSNEGMQDRLRSAMAAQGYSMRRLGLDSGLSETVVHGILVLGRDPRVGTLAKLCETLDTNMAWVLFGSENDSG